MNVTIKIDAPELASAINNLASALQSSNLAPAVAVEEKPKKVEKIKEEPEKAETPPAEEPLKEAPAEKDKTISLEEVREKLAQLSVAGKQKEVKELIQSFGAKKLGDVSSSDYAALLKKAEEL
ncbi:hypothetical protein [Halalkalibacterium ligniniphilum]|uniref:hypothetical protein n=1 Tax=Halalkalibacterium ligniniphilum TaxID=1134413 RepID=UPI0003490FC8|nr:hypothetical protein [Halalkalibacterium ligniniphilum]